MPIIGGGPFSRGVFQETCTVIPEKDKKPETLREELERLRKIGYVAVYLDADRCGEAEVAADLLANHPDIGKILDRIKELEKQLGGELQAEEVLKKLKQ